MQGRETELFEPVSPSPLPETPATIFNVPSKFVELAKTAILHRDAERFAILYRLLWRLKDHRDLLDVATDSDVALVIAMAKAVHRDEHKMHAFVRFREIGREPAHVMSPGLSRSIILSNSPRPSSPNALPTCRGRSSRLRFVRTGTVT